MNTALTLETPEARRALARCVRLLLGWADEDEITSSAASDDLDQEVEAEEGYRP
jgi:hypothetical protein